MAINDMSSNDHHADGCCFTQAVAAAFDGLPCASGSWQLGCGAVLADRVAVAAPGEHSARSKAELFIVSIRCIASYKFS